MMFCAWSNTIAWYTEIMVNKHRSENAQQPRMNRLYQFLVSGCTLRLERPTKNCLKRFSSFKMNKQWTQRIVGNIKEIIIYHINYDNKSINAKSFPSIWESSIKLDRSTCTGFMDYLDLPYVKWKMASASMEYLVNFPFVNYMWKII